MTDEKEKHERDLFKGFAGLSDADEVSAFLRDLCTPQEISAMAERLYIARLLNDRNLSYRDISHRTGASTTTVARVARFLTQENNGGYDRVLDMNNQNKE